MNAVLDLGEAVHSPAFRADPWPVYRELRQREAVHWSAATCTYFLLRYDEVRAALSSEQLTAAHPFRASRQAMGATLLDTDGERHDRLKGALRPRFSRDTVESEHRPGLLEPVVAAALDRLGDRRRVDLMVELAALVPMEVMLRMLGLPPGDGPQLHRELRPIVAYIDAPSASLERAAAAREQLSAYLRERLEALEPSPVGAVLQRLRSSHPGPPQPELVQAALLLLVAGTETTAASIGNLLGCLLGRPGVWEAVGADPELREPAIRESLRWQPPLHTTLRFAREDVELGGTKIRRGMPIQLSLASANRDEQRFVEPDRWMPERPRRADLSFGAGEHSCLGFSLALAEIRTLLDALLDRFPRMRRLEEGAPVGGISFRAPARLEVDLGASG